MPVTVTRARKDMHTGKFVIKNTEKGVHFVLKASNGEIIATSQVYKSMDSCKKGIESVKKNAPDAEVVVEED